MVVPVPAAAGAAAAGAAAAPSVALRRPVALGSLHGCITGDGRFGGTNYCRHFYLRLSGQVY